MQRGEEEPSPLIRLTRGYQLPGRLLWSKCSRLGYQDQKLPPAEYLSGQVVLMPIVAAAGSGARRMPLHRRRQGDETRTYRPPPRSAPGRVHITGAPPGVLVVVVDPASLVPTEIALCWCTWPPPGPPPEPHASVPPPTSNLPSPRNACPAQKTSVVGDVVRTDWVPPTSNSAVRSTFAGSAGVESVPPWAGPWSSYTEHDHAPVEPRWSKSRVNRKNFSTDGWLPRHGPPETSNR